MKNKTTEHILIFGGVGFLVWILLTRHLNLFGSSQPNTTQNQVMNAGLTPGFPQNISYYFGSPNAFATGPVSNNLGYMPLFGFVGFANG